MKKHEIITALEESGLPSDKIDELILAISPKELEDLAPSREASTSLAAPLKIDSDPEGWRTLAAEAAKRIGDNIDA